MSGVGLPVSKPLLKNFSVDEVVKSKLPEGARIISANAHSASFWTQTVRLDVVLFGGTEKAYFLKIAKGDLGKSMLQGEYESAKLLHSFCSNGLPAPVGFGTYASDSDSHFYLCAFIHMAIRIPAPAEFCVILAEMHQNSIGHSFEGKYGFHVSTYKGNMPRNNEWTDTWEEFYVRGFKDSVKQERAVHGRCDELDDLLEPFLEKVVPRLLRPLEWGEKKIRPCLLHGDFGGRRLTARQGTDEPIMIGPAAFWGHNEYELGTFRSECSERRWEWLSQYHKQFPISEPQKDYLDRNALYSIHIRFRASTVHPVSTINPSNNFDRHLALHDMRYLVCKYWGGLDDYEGERPDAA